MINDECESLEIIERPNNFYLIWVDETYMLIKHHDDGGWSGQSYCVEIANPERDPEFESTEIRDVPLAQHDCGEIPEAKNLSYWFSKIL